MRPVYIIGHKNPDVDSIASAVAYQAYKAQTGSGLYLAAAASELSPELVWLLDHLEIPHPVVVKDVGTRVEDIVDDDEIIFATPDATLAELGLLMREKKIKTMPVLDEKHNFLGLITIGDIAMLYMDAVGAGHDIEKSPEILKNLLAKKASQIMKTRDLILFEPDEKVEEARKNMLASRFRNYPVVDES
ncbi:MAG: CBS domain-containing protein, partial [Syntrophomonadaceae bacterium]